MTVGAICNQELITVQHDATIIDVAKLMREYHVGDVVVVESHKNKIIPVGIVTDRDLIIEVVATELDCSVITAGDIMTANLAVVKEAASLLEAIELMTNKGVRRLPVVDNKGSLVGIITQDDLLFLLAKEFSSLTKLVTREHKNEATRRR